MGLLIIFITLFSGAVAVDSYIEQEPDLTHYAEAFIDEVGIAPQYEIVSLKYAPDGRFCRNFILRLFRGKAGCAPVTIGTCAYWGSYSFIEITDEYGALYPRIGPITLKTEEILLHEIGHAYGLGHTGEEDGPDYSRIMNEVSGPITSRESMDIERQLLIEIIRQRYGLITTYKGEGK